MEGGRAIYPLERIGREIKEIVASPTCNTDYT